MANSTGRLDNDSGAVAEHFGRTHHWPGVVPNANHTIRAHFSRVCKHQLKGLFTRPFAQIRENSDPPAK
jgi:hypothetical protein